MLEMHSASRSYGDFKAVNNVSFTVYPGEIVGLLGHNGAGKTTIMKMLSGYLEPDSGSIAYKQSRLLDQPKIIQRELGYLPENLPVYPELSVASYLDYAAELKGLKGAEKRSEIRRVVEATALDEKLLSPIASLSRGLKQRVGVAQAIIGKPSLLILDEPTNGLDPSQTEQMRELIRDISKAATVILSTHIMQEVEAICSRALIIRRGELAIDTKLNELASSEAILLSSRSDEKAIRRALAQLPWDHTIMPMHTDDANSGNRSSEISDKLAQWRIKLTEGQDVFEAIERCVEQLVNAGVAICGIQSESQNLQSLFLKVNATPPHQSVSEEVNHVA